MRKNPQPVHFAIIILFLAQIAKAGCFEPFADATASGGTRYTPGNFLFGQCNVSGNVWFPVTNTPAPPANGFPRIAADSLSYPGLPSSSGNCVSIPADVGVMGRLTLNFAATQGAVYFSFLLKVVDLAGVNRTGTEDNYFAAFGDNVGAQDATLLRAATRVLAKRSGRGFMLGVARNSNKPGDWVFDNMPRNTNEVLFVVGSYDYNDHTANLWIDPPVSTFRSGRPPPPTITARRGADLNRNGVRSFVLGCRTNITPGCLVDELRIARSWSFVTGGTDVDSPSDRSAAAPVVTILRPPVDYRRYITDPAIAARRPNIIFILCDDMGYGDLGVLYQNSRAPGLPREKTPNLDAFAAEGMQLREHYCPAPICAPSRASLLLGVHQGHANVRDQQFDKALEDNHTLGTVLQAAGYATAAIGKWGLGGDDEGGTTPAEWPAYPTRRGFDYFFGYERHGDGHDHYPKEAPYSNHSKQCYDGDINITPMLDKCYTTDLFTARAKKWIIDHLQTHPDQPFFLYLAFDTPHSVYELPTQAYPPGGGLRGGLQWLDRPGHMITTANGQVDSYVYPEYARATYDDDHNPATPEVPWPEVFQRFASGIRRIDDAVGDLKKLLQDLNIETNTLVIFTSDNGPTIEDALHLKRRYAADFFDNFGPMDGIKRDSFEGGIRMPALVRWPGKVPAGTTNFAPSQFQDWMQTLADLAGLPAPARTDGVSLVPTLTGHGRQRPSTVYVEYFDPSSTPNYAEFEPAHRQRLRNQMQVIGLDGYQGVRYDIGSQTDNFEIYDALHDPKEATNLALLPRFARLATADEGPGASNAAPQRQRAASL
jgi:arylsulfatase A-like enzyme